MGEKLNYSTEICETNKHLVLKLELDINTTHDESPTNTFYLAEFHFSQRSHKNDELIVKIEGSYIPSIFERLKKTEEGIEEFFKGRYFNEDKDWKGQRKVMGCILKLEDKVMDDYRKRKTK